MIFLLVPYNSFEVSSIGQSINSSKSRHPLCLDNITNVKIFLKRNRIFLSTPNSQINYVHGRIPYCENSYPSFFAIIFADNLPRRGSINDYGNNHGRITTWLKCAYSRNLSGSFGFICLRIDGITKI